MRQETLNIEQAYQKKLKQLQVQRRIQQSTHVNRSRLRVLQAREEMLAELLQDARKQLATVGGVSGGKYGTLLSGLVLQASVCLFPLSETPLTVYGYLGRRCTSYTNRR